MSASSGSGNVRLTGRDRSILYFLAEHRLVLERQVLSLVGGSPDAVHRRLRTLAASGYLVQRPGFDASRSCVIRPRGLAAIGSRLGPPKANPGLYWHDVGVADLWLAAQRGAFGPLAQVIGERRIRSHDMAAHEEPYAIRLGGYHGDGRERRHYPDLLLVDPRGRRLALELELSLKERSRREEIIGGYGADRRLAGVLYVVEANAHGRSIARALEATAADMGAVGRVHVRCLTALARGEDGQHLGPSGRARRSIAAEAAL